jgi:hypothetical protein
MSSVSATVRLQFSMISFCRRILLGHKQANEHEIQ